MSLKVVHFILIILQIKFSSSVVKYWTNNTDISSRKNWEGENYSKGCEGIILPQQFFATISMGNISTKQIILPDNGVIEIEDEIEINPWSGKCIKVKKLGYVQWLTPKYWRSIGNNTSIPHVEQVPCHFDDVLFPKSFHIAIELPPTEIMVKSIGFVDLKLDVDEQNWLNNDEWFSYRVYTKEGLEQFRTNENYPFIEILINPLGCTEKEGCFCHKQGDDFIVIQQIVCENLQEEEDYPINCLFPLKPIGHCTEICGGIVYLKHGNNFDFKKVKSIIPINNDFVHSHMSNVMMDEEVYSQIIFREADYNYKELSSQKAQEFYQMIIKDLEKFGIRSADLKLSGSFYLRTSYTVQNFLIVFGTLLAAIGFFGIIFTLFLGPFQTSMVNLRIPWLDNGGSNYHYQHSVGPSRPFMFARFENKDDGRISISTSVVDLDNAFRNPLFEEDVGTPASTFFTNVDKGGENGFESTSFENPSFELQSTVIDKENSSEEDDTTLN